MAYLEKKASYKINEVELIDALSDDANQVGHRTLNFSDVDRNESSGQSNS
jgi:hypothetical protein